MPLEDPEIVLSQCYNLPQRLSIHKSSGRTKYTAGIFFFALSYDQSANHIFTARQVVSKAFVLSKVLTKCFKKKKLKHKHKCLIEANTSKPHKHLKQSA